MKTFPKFLIVAIVLFCVAFSIKETGRPKIYDCFLFFNEIELLKIRMHTLYDHVDKFVLVESAETHQGKPKALCFDQNKELFAQFADKIIYIPLHERLNTDDPWVRENYQRNQIVRGLKECNNHDIILISDLDEIADPKCFNELRYHLMRGKRHYIGTTQKMYTYFLNRFSSLWHGTVATTYRSLKDHSPQYFRNRRNKGLRLPNSGWHFTYIGGLDKVVEKLEAFAHSEENTEGKKNRESLLKRMNDGSFVEIDASYPKYIVDNQEYFRSIGFVK